MRQEIVTDEEAQEDEVVDDLLEVELERDVDVLEFKVQVLSDHRDFNVLELDECASLPSIWIIDNVGSTLMSVVTLLFALLALFVFLLLQRFSENVKVRFMRAESQHDQICISTVDAVGGVGVVAFLSSLRSDEVKDFVLTFSWNESV
jgi:hypothetical protein